MLRRERIFEHERSRTLVVPFAELSPAIIAMTKQSKGRALFLLDQYGYKDVPITVIRRITRALPNAELLLTFNIDTLLNYLTNTKGF